MENLNDWEVVSTYTRKQAIEDGVLIDLSHISRPFFKHPLAVTDTIFNAINGEENSRKNTIDFQKFWAIFDELRTKARTTEGGLIEHEHEGAPIYFHCGPGDEGEPVLTLCYPMEL